MKKLILCMTLVISVLVVFSLAVAAPVTVTPAASTPSCPIISERDQGTVELASGKCDCSKCREGQSCCPTANGYCGCFPFPCPK